MEQTDKPTTIRLFSALTVPPDLSAQLMALPHKGLDARWTNQDDFHITIRFFGDLDPASMDDIDEALSRVRRAPFGVEVNGLSYFENKRQSILHAALQSTRKLEALCADIGDVLTPLGFDFGTRPFVPHITVARVQGGRGLAAYTAHNGRKIAARWRATEFSLMCAAAPHAPTGAHYTVLKRYPLMG